MAGIDTWNPSETELDEIVDRFTPDPEPRRAEAYYRDEKTILHSDQVRRMEELQHKKRFLDRQKSEEKVAKGLCGYCERPTPREYCGSTCERSAAFTSIGGALKFHSPEPEK